MPIHDWTRTQAGDFHHFHHGWVGAIADALNCGILPPGYMAILEQDIVRPIPDVVTPQASESQDGPEGGISVAESPPTARVIARIERINYAKRANRIAIRYGRVKVVAIIEVVSSGNKESLHAIRSFVAKAADILDQGVNLLIVDLFPPTSRDPQGLHGAIWDELAGEPFELPPGKPLTVASYLGGDMLTAYVEPVGIGDLLPSLPIFLSEDRYIPAPLEATYQEAWEVFPAMLKELIEPTGKG